MEHLKHLVEIKDDSLYVAGCKLNSNKITLSSLEKSHLSTMMITNQNFISHIRQKILQECNVSLDGYDLNYITTRLDDYVIGFAPQPTTESNILPETNHTFTLKYENNKWTIKEMI